MERAADGSTVPAPRRGHSIRWSAGGDGARADWVHDYASATGERYRLVVTDADGTALDTLATASVDTVWVYRGSRRGSSGWRLF